VTRVSAALLKAIDMPELIVDSKEAYVARAIYYATHTDILNTVKTKLQNNFLTTPLFNLDNYVAYFETGIKYAWDIYERGERPRHIDIASLISQN